ncbi:MAG: glutamine-hydrolyzing carbamoyl-phosphate synthase small subunit [Methanobacteriaceae archaeon]
MDKVAKIALEDGTILTGDAFGYETVKTGELVFSTGMSGYVEGLTDPSFSGEILMATYPLQGNYGVSEKWFQSNKVQVEGFVVREICKQPSMFSYQKTLSELLEEYKVPGISGIDTRNLTIKTREKGALKAALATTDIDDDELLEMALNQPAISQRDLVPLVSTKETIIIGEEFDNKVALIDCGVKKNIINNFLDREIGVVQLPYNTPAETIKDYDVNGIMVSSGPGNPSRVTEAIESVQKLAKDFPICGICMGQQIVAKAFGAKIYKMKFGHRGANQPVKNLITGKITITSQNHGFSIDADSLASTDLELTQINLNDNTPEGFKHKELAINCVQYHPEAGPGPNDTNFIFDEFKETINKY